MKSRVLSFIGRNKLSFIIGIFCYFVMIAVFWFGEWNGHKIHVAHLLRQMFLVPGGTMDALGFPYTMLEYQSTFLPLIFYPIAIFWCGLCVVVIRKTLGLLKPFFSKDYIFCHVKNKAPFHVFILKGIFIGILGSVISMLFNPVFIAILEILASVYDYRDVAAVFKRDNYVLLISLYVVSSLLSGVIYGLLMFYLSTYKAIRILSKDRL